MLLHNRPEGGYCFFKVMFFHDLSLCLFKTTCFTGDLALQTRNLYDSHEGEEEQRVPQVSPPHSLEFGSSSDNEHIPHNMDSALDSNISPKQVPLLLFQ